MKKSRACTGLVLQRAYPVDCTRCEDGRRGREVTASFARLWDQKKQDMRQGEGRSKAPGTKSLAGWSGRWSVIVTPSVKELEVNLHLMNKFHHPL
jgi:hypothetical protein